MATVTRANLFADLAGAEDVRRAWEDLALERKRAAVDALLTVTLLPSGRRGNGFDPEHVEIRWKGETSA